MKISEKSWRAYIARLAKTNEKAAAEMEIWMLEHPGASATQMALAAFGIVTRYGEASAALACAMYDQLAAAQNATVPAAEPAKAISYRETSRAIKGTLRNLHSTVPATTARLVKQAGADTMLKNALRDKAEYAWVSVGDTCPFCLMLGSRGWREMSEKALRYGHAPHIHANCDCEYAVRFDRKSTVAGYDPEKLLAAYESASDGGWQDKLNAMRREQYQSDAERINEQKRIAYRARKERQAK